MTDERDGSDRAVDEERETVRVPKCKRGDEVTRWREVDAEYWAHVVRAQRAYDRLLDEFMGEPGIVYAEQARGDGSIAGKSKTEIRVTVDPDAPDPGLPDEVGGIPVRVEAGTAEDIQ